MIVVRIVRAAFTSKVATVNDVEFEIAQGSHGRRTHEIELHSRLREQGPSASNSAMIVAFPMGTWQAFCATGST